jgi:hypothetical protein
MRKSHAQIKKKLTGHPTGCDDKTTTTTTKILFFFPPTLVHKWTNVDPAAQLSKGITRRSHTQTMDGYRL